MDRMLYIAAAAGKEIMRAQSVNANNLANANTTGFRKDFMMTQSLGVHGPGFESRAYGTTRGLGADFETGSMMSTGNPLDIAIQGQGWLTVEDSTGGEAFTRSGDLKITATGMLTTATGHPLIGNNGGPIVLPPYEKVSIGVDGTITVQPVGQSPGALVVVDRLRLVNPPIGQMVKGDDGLFRTNNGEQPPADPTLRVAAGMTEASNVNVVEEMVSMLELARKFDMQVKVMENAKEVESASSQIMRMS